MTTTHGGGGSAERDSTHFLPPREATRSYRTGAERRLVSFIFRRIHGLGFFVFLNRRTHYFVFRFCSQTRHRWKSCSWSTPTLFGFRCVIRTTQQTILDRRCVSKKDKPNGLPTAFRHFRRLSKDFIIIDEHASLNKWLIL